MKKQGEIKALWPKGTGKFLLMGWVFFLVGAIYVNAQDAKAEKRVRKGKIEKGIARYLRLINKEPSRYKYYFRVADLYSEIGEREKAVKWAEMPIAAGVKTAKYRYELGMHLYRAGRYAEAEKWLVLAKESDANTEWMEPVIRQVREAKVLANKRTGFNLHRVGFVNTPADEIGPVLYRDGLLFASDKKRGFFARLTNPDGKPFFDLYFAGFRGSAVLSDPVYLEGRINTPLNDGPLALNIGETEAFITRNFRGPGKNPRAEKEKWLVIEHTDYINGAWRNPSILPFAAIGYNTAHPTLSAQGDTLLFSSDMPGGYGGFDLYRSVRSDSGWSPPQNLGPGVNTSHDELYPHLTSGNLLYFTSDRPGGLGDLDIYIARIDGGKAGLAINPGPPVNSAWNDFGVWMKRNDSYGYFCSDRPGGAGKSDVYGFSRYHGLLLEVVDSETGEPLQDAKVGIANMLEEYSEYQTDSNGLAHHFLPTEPEAWIKVNREGYKEKAVYQNMRKVPRWEDEFIHIELEPAVNQSISIEVAEAVSSKPVSGANIRLIGLREEKLQTDEEGKAFSGLEPAREYVVIVQKRGYRPEVKFLETPGEEEEAAFEMDFGMVPGDFVFVEGKVVEQETGKEVPAPAIQILDQQDNTRLGYTRGLLDGRYWASIPAGKDFTLIASHKGYFTESASYDWAKLNSDTVNAVIHLHPVREGQVIKTIYFPYGESVLGPTGRRDLQEISIFLKDNPQLVVELIAHTDSRGNSRFNQRLSERRAAAAVSYLNSLGIPGRRIRPVGKGESELVNGCADGVECTEQEHQQNRRTEVRVVKMLDGEFLSQ